MKDQLIPAHISLAYPPHVPPRIAGPKLELGDWERTGSMPDTVGCISSFHRALLAPGDSPSESRPPGTVKHICRRGS